MKPCSHLDMQYINDRYEYRIMAVSVIDHVMLESDLSDGARVLWMAIYRDAGLRHEMKCQASTSFLAVKLNKSEPTIWRLIKELRESGYLDVTKRVLPDGTCLPNIYGPRLPSKIAADIKRNATKREKVSKEITAHELSATNSDYENMPNESVECTESEKVQRKTDHDCDLSATERRSETFLEQYRVMTAVRQKSSDTESLTSHQTLTYCGEISERGEGIESDRQSIIIPPTEDLTTTGSHSRSSWKMYPHIRLLTKQKLLDMGIGEQKAKRLIKEIDWTLRFGSMEWWPVQKAINVCMKLIRENEWKSPHASF